MTKKFRVSLDFRIFKYCLDNKSAILITDYPDKIKYLSVQINLFQLE